jgi:1-aminocyclopropane-1-carboxylate deaminase/D-cysteine desulfhydrase-like pyridoxal-dependent ACC family enzyme
MKSTQTDLVRICKIEKYNNNWVKREDLFSIAGVNGGKARSCWKLMQGARGVVTAGSRKSPQINIVASIAKELGIPCHAHTPCGELGKELLLAKSKGANIIQHSPGYNPLLIRRARKHAEECGYLEIPFGMICDTAVEETRKQVVGRPEGVKRIVIPVGSGMSLTGLIWGLEDRGLGIPILGVVVGKKPIRTLNQWAPFFWNRNVTLIPSGVDYHKEVHSIWNGIRLDPIYEAKCIPFLEDGDLFWIVGVRESI